MLLCVIEIYSKYAWVILATIVLLTVGLTKKTWYKISEYFPEPKSLGARVKVELDFTGYATKAV